LTGAPAFWQKLKGRPTIDGNKLTVDFVEAGRKRVVESFVALGT